MKKTIAQRRAQKWHSQEDSAPKGAVPAYLLDRESF